MRKLRILSIVVILSLLTIGCSKVDCERYCRQLTEKELLLTPYLPNDSIYFYNTRDTFKVLCTSRIYYDSVDTYADHYTYDYCDGVQKTYFWQQAVKLTSNIPYTDNTKLEIEIYTRTNYSFDEGVFSLRLFDKGWSEFSEQYDFFTQRNNSQKLFKERVSNSALPPAYHQCDLNFYSELRINGFTYQNVHVLYGDIKLFDSVYYNSDFGIIKMVRDTMKLNLIR